MAHVWVVEYRMSPRHSWVPEADTPRWKEVAAYTTRRAARQDRRDLADFCDEPLSNYRVRKYVREEQP